MSGDLNKGLDNIFAVWKPKGPTSHDIINKIRKITGVRKVGHAGTLDPLASGILVVGVGREATKKLKDAVAAEKEYIALIRLGENSSTDDAEGVKEKIHPVRNSPPRGHSGAPSAGEISNGVKKFIGKIEQTPPIFSAVKVRGKEAYKYARAGKEIIMKPRPVEIKSIKILKYKWPDLKIKVTTGPGVYIRALARDLGQEFKTGGYLAELERVRVGSFLKKNALRCPGSDRYPTPKFVK